MKRQTIQSRETESGNQITGTKEGSKITKFYSYIFKSLFIRIHASNSLFKTITNNSDIS